MLSLDAAILQALAGTSGQTPMRGDDLLAHLGLGKDPDRVNDALEDLVDRRAVNRAEITRNGHTHTVLWLTGARPAPIGRAFTINKFTQADAKAAHEAQVQSESSRSASLKSPPAPLYERGEKNPEQEPDMPRNIPIPRPGNPLFTKAANGTVMGQVHAALAGLTEATAATPEELLPKCPATASIGSLRATLRTLARRGDLNVRTATARGKVRAFYWPIEANAVEEPALKPRDLDAWEAQAEPAQGRDEARPDPAARAADLLGLDAPVGVTRFALWDDGQLLLTVGEDMLVLDAGSTRRLADFLESCMGTLA